MSGSLNDSSALMEKPEHLTPMKKRKESAAEELTNCRKSRIETQNTRSLKMESLILEFHMLVNLSLRASILLD